MLNSSIEAENLFDHQSVCNTVGEMVESTELVRHGVADTQEGVGEGHTRHGGGVGHLLTCLYVGLSVVVGALGFSRQELLEWVAISFSNA